MEPKVESLVPIALLLARVLVAACGVALVCGAALSDSTWPALAAAGAFWGSEALGLLQLSRKLEGPAARTLLVVCESLCSLGVAVILPGAILVALVQVVHALVASGISTVSGSQGKVLGQPRSESLRRSLGAGANCGLAYILFAAARGLSVEATLGVSAADLALICAALVTLASVRSVTELGLSAKWGK